MTTDHTPYEVGLGFTVSKSKADFRGREALLSAKGAEKIINVCLDIEYDDMVAGGEELHLEGQNVGVINSPCYSHRLGKSLALAHVSPAASRIGTQLQVSGGGIDTGAIVVAMPIYDPQKTRTHAD